MFGMTGKTIAVLSALFLVQACVDTSQPLAPDAGGNRAALRAQLATEMIDAILPMQFAEKIAEECSRYRHNRRRVSDDMDAMQQDLTARGYTAADFRMIAKDLPVQEVQSKLFQWIENRKIVLTDRGSFCRAGDTEIAERSAVARYLVAR